MKLMQGDACHLIEHRPFVANLFEKVDEINEAVNFVNFCIDLHIKRV